MHLYRTQGGGLVYWDDLREWFVFRRAPDWWPEAAGTEMPDNWGIAYSHTLQEPPPEPEATVNPYSDLAAYVQMDAGLYCDKHSRWIFDETDPEVDHPFVPWGFSPSY